MRHRLLTIISTLLFVCHVAAENEVAYPRNQFHLGLGANGLSSFIYAFNSNQYMVNNSNWMSGTTYTTGYKATGSVNFGYLRSITPVYSCGADFAYSAMYQRIYNLETGAVNHNYIHNTSLLFTSRFTYCRHEHVNLYSGVSVGVRMNFYNPTLRDEFTNQRINVTDFALQLTPIGVSVGGTHFRYFCELGLGQKGICTMGLQYRFGTPDK